MVGEASRQAKELLRRFPLSAFLREEAGEPDLAHLAADSNRVMGVAAEYARLGMYRKAVAVLSREYPEVAADQREPGSVVPQKNPMIVYLRAYYREKAGESGDAGFCRRRAAVYFVCVPEHAKTRSWRWKRRCGRIGETPARITCWEHGFLREG